MTTKSNLYPNSDIGLFASNAKSLKNNLPFGNITRVREIYDKRKENKLKIVFSVESASVDQEQALSLGFYLLRRLQRVAFNHVISPHVTPVHKNDIDWVSEDGILDLVYEVEFPTNNTPGWGGFWVGESNETLIYACADITRILDEMGGLVFSGIALEGKNGYPPMVYWDVHVRYQHAGRVTALLNAAMVAIVRDLNTRCGGDVEFQFQVDPPEVDGSEDIAPNDPVKITVSLWYQPMA